MSTTSDPSHPAAAPHGNDLTAALVQLAQVQGQLSALTTLITAHHDSAGKRIDDFERHIGSRLDGIDRRLSTVEDRERATAMRTAAVGASAGAVVTAGFELLKRAIGH